MANHITEKNHNAIRDKLFNWVQKNTYGLQQEVLNEVAETFCYRVKRRIRSASYQMAPESNQAINNIADAFYFKKATKTDETAVVNIADSMRDEFLYLEFGTGIKGRDNPHPEAGNVGWSYANRIGAYFKTYKRPNYGKLKGWTFELVDDDRQLVTKDDHTVTDSMFTKYTYKTKMGTVTKYYRRGTRTDKNWVHTSGIRPVRALYNTKREFKRFLGYYSEEKGNINNLIKKLRKMRNEKVEVTNG